MLWFWGRLKHESYTGCNFRVLRAGGLLAVAVFCCLPMSFALSLLFLCAVLLRCGAEAEAIALIRLTPRSRSRKLLQSVTAVFARRAVSSTMAKP